MSKIITDLLFSFNTVLPIFLIILLGFYMRKRGTVDDKFIGTVSTLVFYYALPAGMFKDVAQSDIRNLANPRFIIVTVLGTFFVFCLAWIVAVLTIKEKRTIAAVVHGSYRGNYVYIGLPIILNILQTDFVACSVLVLTFLLPVYNILGVFILSYYGEEGSGIDPVKIIMSIIKNPMIIASVLGIIYALTGLGMSSSISRTLSSLGSVASPMALIMIGARMVGNKMEGSGKAIAITTFFKLIFGPVLMTCVAIWLGMPSEEIVSIFVIFGVPSALNTFVMARSMGGDDSVAASVIITTVAGSALTMTAGIYLLRMFNIV